MSNDEGPEIITEYGFSTTKTRSELMKKIKATETKVEVAFRKQFWYLGYRYRKNFSKLPGKPDIAFTKHKVAVFVDGEFWHGYNWDEKKNRIKRNRDYWVKKIERNIARDEINTKELEKMGWTVIRFWANSIKKDMELCVNAVLDWLEK